MESLQNILVFATNIKTETDKEKVSPALSTHSDIMQWNIDQQDIDCVLRIVSDKLSTHQIIEIITHYNFECKELD